MILLVDYFKKKGRAWETRYDGVTWFPTKHLKLWHPILPTMVHPNLFFKIPLCKSTLWLWWRWSAWPLASKCDIYFHRQCLIQGWIYNTPPRMIHQLQLGDPGLVIHHHCSNQNVWKPMIGYLSCAWKLWAEFSGVGDTHWPWNPANYLVNISLPTLVS